jgi:hypothetical protein
MEAPVRSSLPTRRRLSLLPLLALLASLVSYPAHAGTPADDPPVVPIDVDGPVALPVPYGYEDVGARIGVALDDPYAQIKRADGSPLFSDQPPELLDRGYDAYPPVVAARGAGVQSLRVAADVAAFVQCDGGVLRWGDGTLAIYGDLYRRAFAAGVRLQIVLNQGRKERPCLPLLGAGGSIAPYLDFVRTLARQNRALREEFNAGHPAAPVEPLVYQIFNEPNNGGEPILGESPELFARVVYESTLAIRAVDPSAQVVSGGFGGGETAERGAPIDILDYVRRFIVAYRARLPAAALVPRQTPGLVDAIGYNPYGDQNNIAWLRKQLDVAGFGALPIDAAEWGIHNDDSNSDVIANSLEASEDLRLQTVFLLNTLEKPVRNIMIWTLRRSYLEPDKRRTAGLVDEVEDAVDTPNQTDVSCTEAGAYSNIAGVSGYFCRPKMYALATLLRVSEDRRLVGSLLSSRDELGQQQPGNGGVHAIKFEGGGPYGLDDVIAVWCPRTDSDGCAFQFSKRPVAALDRVGRWIDHTAGAFKTDELAGVQYYFFSHPAPPVSPTPDVPAALTATASAPEPTTPLATPRSTPFPTALATPIPTPYEPPPGPVCPTYLNCVFMPGVRRF